MSKANSPPVAREVTGLRRLLMNLVDRLYFATPLRSEVTNQVMAKNQALLKAWHFLRNNDVRGAYLEFGVFRGETFLNSMRACRQVCGPARLAETRFLAFDSFAGLPSTPSMQNAAVVWRPGDFSAPRRDFENRVRSFQKRTQVEVHEGFFDQSLPPLQERRREWGSAAFVNVDCDLYESTVPVLEFITPLLQTGTILFFDDWYSCRGSLQEGEPRACREWLERHGEIQLVDYGQVAIGGHMFIVNRVSGT